MRWQLAYPGQPIPIIGTWLGQSNSPGGIMLPEFYNQLGAMLAPIFAGVVLSFALAGRIHAAFDRAFSGQRVFEHYARMFALVTSGSFGAPLLAAQRSSLRLGGMAADQQMLRLHRIMSSADLRFSAGLLYFLVQAFTLWDLHVGVALERWRQRAGCHAREWMSALGVVDALASLAALRHDQPGWVFPEIVENARPHIRATGLGHPLIADAARVANDVEIGPPGTVLLVTGSNMSGKSTLLRAIGLNLVLAQAGGPVCASWLQVPAADLHTSMRVQDSLELGLSYFMAALARLKALLQTAREARARGRPFVFLLDEILQGTNSAERQVAVRLVVERLLADEAIGAITTHDLTLAQTKELTTAARLVHFSETIAEGRGGSRMSFDYTLRPGLATSRNALALMRMIGIE
ncbi:MAG: hypothetical protein LC804_24905 [Acidobacteria bacterium]|nr:hypothetical protein [Acidobacteriota bacterium]